jgi:hypothetical protein
VENKKLITGIERGMTVGVGKHDFSDFLPIFEYHILSISYLLNQRNILNGLLGDFR